MNALHETFGFEVGLKTSEEYRGEYPHNTAMEIDPKTDPRFRVFRTRDGEYWVTERHSLDDYRPLPAIEEG